MDAGARRDVATAWALRVALRLLGATWRFRVDDARAPGALERRGVLCFWHFELLPVAWFLRRRRLARGGRVALLASHSRDGELGAVLGRMWGADVARGSSSRGGSAGLRALYRFARSGSLPIVSPDGPRGPARRAKPGAVALAQALSLPLVPVGLACDRCWRLRSWDRMAVPRPFARVALRVGPPLDAAGDPAAATERLERALDALVEVPD